ncbi:Mpp10 protein-domain-containing protein, partial [Ochromonadaceae sp. CCMP2298]
GGKGGKTTPSSGAVPVTGRGARNAALALQIAQLEKELVAPKAWELRGEVGAGERPENSFLDLHAEVERTSKPRPVVTQEFTLSLEQLITLRVKEGRFDDVVVRVAAVDAGAGDRAEANALFQRVSRQLDALSHFHFTPRPM